MAIDRKATTVWQGDLPSGKGEFTLDSSQVGGMFAVSAPARFEPGPHQQTSPEELIAAAHSSCFSMALSGALGRAGHAPERIETSAVVSIDRQDGGYAITRSAITVRASVPGMSAEEFREFADQAKAGCPVSRALTGNLDITLDASLV